MEGNGVTDGGNVFEVNGIWYFETSHPIIVSPLLEMDFECSSTPVRVVATDFALILDS